ncbi:TPA: hypothetical protein DEB02_01930 [Candidatus Beckwithbacteria bacterium]|nr:hypothetical protein [Candidatus Beckwithbacteria bacterium]
MTHSIFDENNPALIWRSQFMDYIPIERFGMKIVRPWLDHPPLGAAIIALPAKLLGFKALGPIPQMVVRFPALVASIFTLYLTYALARDLFSQRAAKLAVTFLATVPYFVVAHRQSFLENILTPVFLAVLIYLRRFLHKKAQLMPVVALAFVSGWIKVVGFAVPLMLAVWAGYKKNFKVAIKLAAVGLASAASYAIYGLAVDKQLFVNTLTNQSVRGAFVSSFLNAVTTIEFYGPFRDGWYVLGFILMLALIVKNKSDQERFYSWFAAAWLVVIFLTSGTLANSPWYRYPLIPFMAMALGFYADRFLKQNSLFLALPFWLLGLTGLDLIGADLPSSWLRLATVIFFSVYGLNLLVKNRLVGKLAKLTTRVFLAALVLLNIYVNLRFETVYCSHERCLAPTKIILEAK